MRLSYSRNPLLLLACFTDQSSEDHFDIMPVLVTDTFMYSVIITVGLTTVIVSISAAVLPAVAPFP